MTTPTHRKRTPARLKVMAVMAVAASTLAVGAGGARADDDRADPQPATPAWVRAEEQRRLCQTVALMPSYWPATQAMRAQAEQPLGDAVERATWAHEADLMPSYWSAAQALRAAAAPHMTCPT